MKRETKELLAAGIILPFIIVGAYYFLPSHTRMSYNCSIAEISPDFPIEVREQCRKLNMQKGLWVPK